MDYLNQRALDFSKHKTLIDSGFFNVKKYFIKTLDILSKIYYINYINKERQEHKQ